MSASSGTPVRGNKFFGEEVLTFPAEGLFSIVLDVERYPEFLPWCKRVKITDSGDSHLVAEVVAGVFSLRGGYTSHVSFRSPEGDRPGWVKVRSEDGVFRLLQSEWNFLPMKNGETLVKFSIDFSFKHKILQVAFDVAADAAKRRIMSAFRARAQELFG
ncbi:type II toxin-antitoxin system RatA family toxin [Anaplasma capra]|uniref:type II toxin-antitoxin system RatA family toxin n=1 Tax=Anaplasma capra TaxID=1562740 RepID=UPI0021D5C991|nr:type II toxin-antitoxin system RatA family toxin [Anaplasma capra]MCU7611523.1 type II toxin-antitoxin system RatA family toxin [Anaplasma capra]MCU7612038.1 type II toxin-antitoxin system RatA family toxin [Anaplasma capra]